MYVGEPILAVAALSDETARRTRSRRSRSTTSRCRSPSIRWRACFPDGTDARVDGNIGTLARECRRPSSSGPRPISRASNDGKTAHGQAGGGVELRRRRGAASSNARWCTTRRFVTASNSHHSMEPRTAMAYWQNGKCFVHALVAEPVVRRCRRWRRCSASSRTKLVLHRRVLRRRLRLQGQRPIPPWPSRRYMSKKIGKPVMMRISRAEEYYLGSRAQRLPGQRQAGLRRRRQAARRGRLHRAGTRRAHRLLGLPQRSAMRCRSSINPKAMRWRGMPGVLQHAHAHRAARARAEPDRLHHGAAGRPRGARAQDRPRGDPQAQQPG